MLEAQLSTGEKWGVGILLWGVGFIVGRMVWMVFWAPDKIEEERERLARTPWRWTEQDLGPFWYRVYVGCIAVFMTIIWSVGTYEWAVEVFGR
jgi:hypothetical protein